jgi:integrase
MARPRKHKTNLPPCVHFKHGAHYYVKGGSWRRLPAEGRSTLASALEAYAELLEAPEGTMAALIDTALEAMRQRTPALSKSTLRQYGQAARTLKRKLRQFRPEQVQPKHVAAIKLAMASTPNMANRCLSFLRQVFDYAVEQQLIPSNPAASIKRHREGKRTRLPTAEEFAAVMEQAGDRLQVIAELARFTGQRIQDVLHIEHAHLTQEGILFDPEKTGKPFYAAWSPELRAVVDRAKALRSDGLMSFRWLLPGRSGKEGPKPPDYRSVSRQWRDACTAAGVQDLHFHDLRAMALTQAEREKLDPQALGRHSTPERTKRYLRDRSTPVVSTPRFRGKE